MFRADGPDVQEPVQSHNSRTEHERQQRLAGPPDCPHLFPASDEQNHRRHEKQRAQNAVTEHFKRRNGFKAASRTEPALPSIKRQKNRQEALSHHRVWKAVSSHFSIIVKERTATLSKKAASSCRPLRRSSGDVRSQIRFRIRRTGMLPIPHIKTPSSSRAKGKEPEGEMVKKPS